VYAKALSDLAKIMPKNDPDDYDASGVNFFLKLKKYTSTDYSFLSESFRRRIEIGLITGEIL
jgi:hypothetical protein